MEGSKKIIIAVTGASGAIYARQLAEALQRSPQVGQIAMIASNNGGAVAKYEKEALPAVDGNSGSGSGTDGKIVWFDNGDMFAPPASGSSSYDAMVVVPCSAGSAGRIASGVSLDLIGRAADVMLKERRRLILVIRETPLSTIHLRNLLVISECGGIILPACPSFYSRPADIEQLCGTVTGRVLDLLGIGNDSYRWGK